VGSKSIVIRAARPLPPPALLLDYGIGQHVRHVAQLRPAHRVLEPRQGRLRGQGRPGDRIALDQQLVDRVVGQARGVVAVGVATHQPEDALADQLEGLMPDLARLALVDQTAGQLLGQSQVGIDALQQNRATVRTGVRLVEAGHDRLRKSLAPEGDLGYTGCSHRASSFVCGRASRHRFYSTDERLGGSSLSSFVNFPG
jgi:hypothetical protein